MQPSEIGRMAYWEWEMTLEKCHDIIEEEKKQREEQEKGYKGNSYYKQARQMMNGYSNGMPKIPSVPRMPSAPSIPRVPKI